MVAPHHRIIQRLLASSIIMGSTWFVLAYQGTIKTAVASPMMTHKTIYTCHPRAICSGESKKRERCEYPINFSIPNAEPLLVNCCEMVKAREEEAVDIFWFAWPRNKSTRKNMFLLVSYIR